MRVGKSGPGAREGAGEGGEATKGGKRITGIRITGRESWGNREVLVGPPSLPDVGRAGTGGKSMACCPTVCAEPSVRPATAFLNGEWPATTPRTVDIHGVRSGKGKNLGGRRREGKAGKGIARGLVGLLGMGAREREAADWLCSTAAAEATYSWKMVEREP